MSKQVLKGRKRRIRVEDVPVDASRGDWRYEAVVEELITPQIRWWRRHPRSR